MLRARTGGDDELIALNRYAAGYFELLRWFLKDVAPGQLENGTPEEENE
jgi:hypothetical protein